VSVLLYGHGMKKVLALWLFCLLGLLFMVKAAHASSRYGAPLSLRSDNRELVSDFKVDEENFHESWKAIFYVCWKKGRASFCTPQTKGAHQSMVRFEALCSRSQSANCPDPTCALVINGQRQSGIIDAVILKGDERDSLLLKGTNSGCGATAYSLHVLGEDAKFYCGRSITLEGSSSSHCVEQVQADPYPFIEWSAAGCTLNPYAAKARSFFNACSLDSVLGAEMGFESFEKDLSRAFEENSGELREYLATYGTLRDPSGSCLRPAKECPQQKSVLKKMVAEFERLATPQPRPEHKALLDDLRAITSQKFCLPTRKTPATCI